MPILPAEPRSYYDDEETPTEGEAPATGATAVIPASLLQGKQFAVGDRVVLRIESVDGDQVVVSYPEEALEEGAEEAPVDEVLPPEGMPPDGGAEAEADPLYD